MFRALLAALLLLALPAEAREAPRHGQSFLRFALVPETNPVRRTTAETIDIAGLPFTLSEDARAKSGTGLRLTFGHVALPPLGPRSRARLAFVADGRFFEDRALNEVTVRAEAGVEFALGREGRMGAGLLAQGRWLGDRPYSSGPGVYLTWAQGFGPDTLAEARAEMLWLSHPGAAWADGRRTTLAFALRHRAGPRLVLGAEAVFTRQQAAAASEAMRGASLALSADYAFAGGLDLGVTVSRGSSRRDGPAGLFGRTREDDLTAVSLRFSHRAVQVKGFQPVLEVTRERQSSTIALHDYATTRVSMGFARRF